MIPDDIAALPRSTHRVDALPQLQLSPRLANTTLARMLVPRLIQHESEFGALQQPWCALAAACGARPFQEFGWAEAWVETIGRTDGRQLRIGTVWRGDQLVAVLPLVRRRYLGVRLLEWIGSRVTDYCDALVHPDIDSQSALQLLWETVTDNGDCDVIRLGQVRDDASIRAFLDNAHLSPWVETREHTCFLPVRWSDGGQWLESQGAHARKEARYDFRRLAKEGFEYYVWKAPDPYAPVLEALIAQKSAWLARKGSGTLMGNIQGCEFLRKSVAQMAAQGSLHLSAFRSRHGFAACHLGFHHRGVLYGYMPTYDPRWSGYSAGSAIRNAFIMWGCDHAVAKIDLLRGMSEFKLRYRPEQEGLQTYVIACGRVGQACVAAYRMRLSRT